jgi:hypothetical protein
MKDKVINTKQDEVNPLVLKLQKLRKNKDVSSQIKNAKQKNTTNNN